MALTSVRLREVWNRHAALGRTVLIVDLWQPRLAEPEREAIRLRMGGS